MSLDKYISSDAFNLVQAKVDRLKESDSALQRLRGKNADVYLEATEIRVYNKLLSIRVLFSGYSN